MSNSQARVEDVFAEAARLFASKNRNYGDSWREQGWRGNVSRILEKSKRVRNMVWRQSVLLNGSSEHPRETMLDMINTLAFAIINMDDGVEWGEGVDNKPIALPADSDLEQFRLSYGDPTITREQMEEAQQPTNRQRFEETLITSHIGEVPVPGEEKPSPRSRRAQVTDRGSGPHKRPAKDQPQA